MNTVTPSSGRNWNRILAVCGFNLVVIWLLLGNIDPDLRHRLSTMEVFTLVVTPTILFYLRNNWPLSKWGMSALGVAGITVLTYSVLHEASHVLGVYAIGSKPVEVHLIPKFWAGEFATGASVSSQPVAGWIGALPGLAPYIKDILFLLVGAWILKRTDMRSAFLAGLVYVTLCVAPLFDLVNNYLIYLVLGRVSGNDFYGTALRWGAVWTHGIGLGFCIFALVTCAWILWFYGNHPNTVLE